MIVTCPSCGARYKINESKVKGRGAKITCPRCAHRFVFYREGEEPARPSEDPVALLDFRNVGITWKARSQGTIMEFTNLGTLLGWLHDGKLETVDQISFNGRKWTYIEQIPDLSAYFAEIHRKCTRGEISLSGDDDAEEEDDSDAPTTIAGRGSRIASEISDAVRDAATPGPAEARSDAEEEEVHGEMEPEMGTPIPVVALKGSHAPQPSPMPQLPPPPVKPVVPPAPNVTAAKTPPAKTPAAKAPSGGGMGGGMAIIAGAGAILLIIVVIAGLFFGGVIGGHAKPTDLIAVPASESP